MTPTPFLQLKLMVSDLARLRSLFTRADSNSPFAAQKAGRITGIPAKPRGHTPTPRLQSSAKRGATEEQKVP